MLLNNQNQYKSLISYLNFKFNNFCKKNWSWKKGLQKVKQEFLKIRKHDFIQVYCALNMIYFTLFQSHHLQLTFELWRPSLWWVCVCVCVWERERVSETEVNSCFYRSTRNPEIFSQWKLDRRDKNVLQGYLIVLRNAKICFFLLQNGI